MASRVGDRNITIRTARLLLRPTTNADAGPMFALRSEFEVMKWTPSKPETDISQTEAWLRDRILGKPEIMWQFSVEALDDADPALVDIPAGAGTRKVVGLIGTFRAADVGYAFHRAVWGRGYATEALSAFMPRLWEFMPRPQTHARALAEPGAEGDGSSGQAGKAEAGGVAQDAHSQEGWTFEHGTDVVSAILDPEHVASARVLEKCGFTLWRITRKDFDSPNLGLRDTAEWKIARPGTVLGTPPVQQEKEGGGGGGGGIV